MADEFYDLIKSQSDADPSFSSLLRTTAGKIERREDSTTPHPQLGELRYAFQVQGFDQGLVVTYPHEELSKEELIGHLDAIRAYLASDE